MSVKPKRFQKGNEERGAKTSMQLARQERVDRQWQERDYAAKRELARQRREEDIAQTLDDAAHDWVEIHPEGSDERSMGFYVYRVSYIRDAAKKTGDWFHWNPDWLKNPPFRIIQVDALAKLHLEKCKSGETVVLARPDKTGDKYIDGPAYQKWSALVSAVIDYAKVENANAGRRLFFWGRCDCGFCIQYGVKKAA